MNEGNQLDQEEEEAVEERLSLRAPMIYEVVRREGEEELRRPDRSLWWSGLVAGFALSTSVYFESFLHHYLPDRPWRPLVENFGYSFGFVLVILGRLQLFTENTISVILPILAAPSWQGLVNIARLWTIVLLANLLGTLISAGLAVHGHFAEPDQLASALDLARHYAEPGPLEILLKAIPAGFLIAALVWILPGARGSELWVIILVTYVIALGDLAHVIAGATEIFMLVFTYEIGVGTALAEYLLPSLLGNIAGGTLLFAVLAWAQVSQEL